MTWLVKMVVETLKTRGIISPELPALPVATASMMLSPGDAMPRRLRLRISCALEAIRVEAAFVGEAVEAD